MASVPVIDFHHHLWSLTERYASVRQLVLRGSAVNADVQPAETDELASRADNIRREMAAAGVDASVLLLADYGLYLGETSLGIAGENGQQADLTGGDHSFISFFGIDPRRPYAGQQFESALQKHHAQGLKLHPCVGFSPGEPVCDPLYEIAAAYRVPVAIHTGPIASPLRSQFADPVHIDEAAAKHPATDFVMLHAGQQCWFPAALEIARWKPNIHLEISTWQWESIEEPDAFTAKILRMKRAIGLDRVLFGSDRPGLAHLMPLADWVQVFRGLPDQAHRFGSTITEAEVQAVLGGNAARLLRLPG